MSHNYYEIHNDDQNHLNVKNEDKNVQIDIQGVVMKSEFTWERKMITNDQISKSNENIQSVIRIKSASKAKNILDLNPI